MTSEVDIFALIAMGEIPASDRANLVPSDFFGHESDVQAIKNDPKAAIMAITQREWPDVSWDGVNTLRWSVIDRFRAICARNRGEAHLRVDKNHIESAMKILANHRANGGVSRAVVEAAEKVVAEFGRKNDEKPNTTKA